MMIHKLENSLESLEILFPVRVNKAHEYYIIIVENDVVGLFEIQPLSKITGILHLHILEKHQKRGLAINAVNELINVLQNSSYQQLIGTIPENNKHIMSIVNKTKAKCCGLIKDGIIWNDILTNLVLFQLEVKSNAVK